MVEYTVRERFCLSNEMKTHLKEQPVKFGFGIFGEAVFYRTYSRLNPDGTQEQWADTVIRVVEGIMSIRKDYYIRNRLPWSDVMWRDFAADMALYMFNMYFLPAGRGLWAMGTNLVYNRGSAALYNCAAVDTSDLIEAATWTMDMLMHGCGIGANVAWTGCPIYKVDKESNSQVFIIPDSREGWVQALKLLLNSYIPINDARCPYPKFDYSSIRPAGTPLKTFGGIASGYKPLEDMLLRIENTLDRYMNGELSPTRVCADIINYIGVCVVAGNVRRSSEILLGDASNREFFDLKNYEKNPDRANYGWMSNNSILLKRSQDFESIPDIAKRIQNNGEPGILNIINIQKFGRYGDVMADNATLCNPCGEIPLESYETCNLAECFPTKSITIDNENNIHGKDIFMKALEYAAFYTSTIALLPTHQPKTNAIISRNRRIGVSLSGIADLLEHIGAAHTTRLLRDGYRHVKDCNIRFARDAGVPASIRVTTVKPSGSISQLTGVSSGMHFPTFRYAIRRMRVSNTTPFYRALITANVPHEPAIGEESVTEVFEFPIDQSGGVVRSATEVSAWEQFALLAMLQREWADNMVSCTVYYNPQTEAHQIEKMLGQYLPIIKSVSMLPHTEEGKYQQMPYQGISKEEYDRRVKEIGRIDWSAFIFGDATEPKYCTNDTCDYKVQK